VGIVDMETKFKVGDVIFDPNDKCPCTVLDIVFEKKRYQGNWRNASHIDVWNSYILQASNNTHITYLDFISAEHYRLVTKSNKPPKPIVVNSSCPRCKTELIEKPSFGLGGEIIKKCPNPTCGWC
jgi:hypothetical protein